MHGVDKSSLRGELYFLTKCIFVGISMSGSCLGTFVLAPVSSILSENYGWKATVGLYSGNILST